MKGERAITVYVAAQRELDALRAADSADLADYEHTLKQKVALVGAYYRNLSGGQLAEARRRLLRGGADG